MAGSEMLLGLKNKPIWQQCFRSWGDAVPHLNLNTFCTDIVQPSIVMLQQTVALTGTKGLSVNCG